MPGVVIIPVKSFALGKGRLSGELQPDFRARLGRALAERVASAIRDSGHRPLVVTADAEVATWATEIGCETLADPGAGLSAAASHAAAHATDRGEAWLMFHSDLPWISTGDVVAMTQPLHEGRDVIAPSADGGTSAIGSRGVFHFRFGPASFHKHLASLDEPVVVKRSGLLLDIDTPRDLEAAMAADRGTWLRGALASAS